MTIAESIGQLLSEWFLRPGWWPGLFAAPATWLLLRATERVRRRRLRALLGPRADLIADRRRGPEPGWAAAAALLFALAWMEPSFEESDRERARAAEDLVFCVDVSRSMLAQDLDPDRLTRARREILEFVREHPENRYGLVAFAGTAKTICPLTEDHGAFAFLVESLEPYIVPVGGTDLAEALAKASSLADESERGSSRSGSSRRIVLVTDGGEASDTEGAIAWMRTRDADRPAVRVDVLGVGTERGAKIPSAGATSLFVRDERGDEVVDRLEVDPLRQLAAFGRGSYADFSRGGSPLEQLEREPLSEQPDTSVRTGRAGRRPGREFQWVLGLALLCGTIASFAARSHQTRETQA